MLYILHARNQCFSSRKNVECEKTEETYEKREENFSLYAMLSGFSFTYTVSIQNALQNRILVSLGRDFPWHSHWFAHFLSFWFYFLLQRNTKFCPLVIFNYSQHLNGNKIRKQKNCIPIFEGGHVYSFNIWIDPSNTWQNLERDVRYCSTALGFNL